MTLLTATLATRKEACEYGARLIEHELRELRTKARKYADGHDDQYEIPIAQRRAVTTSHEGDVMHAMELASAHTWLKAMALENE